MGDNGKHEGDDRPTIRCDCVPITSLKMVADLRVTLQTKRSQESTYTFNLNNCYILSQRAGAACTTADGRDKGK
jgi:hypothetical protein